MTWEKMITQGGHMDVYMVRPEVESSASVIVLQEAYGVNPHIQDVCHRVAALGYTALAPDLFHRFGKRIQYDYDDRKSAMEILAWLTDEMILEDVSSTLAHVQTSRVHAMGFCMGGYAAILSGLYFPLTSVISFYGAGLIRAREGIGFGPVPRKLKEIKCPALLFFGEDDKSISTEERELISDELSLGTQEVLINTFPHSDHGFFCDQRKTYHPKSSVEAWTIVKNWLNRPKK